ncbi:MAG: branched-chain amino acid ABC transporter permease [Nitrospinota bacterium]
MALTSQQDKPGFNYRRLLLILLLAGLILIPIFTSRFYVYLTIQIFLLSLLALGFNLLLGYTGLLSFGHAAFYATGAYATGLTLMRLTPSLLPAFFAGILVSALMALAIGFFCVRHTRIYFAMLTLAFGMMIYSLAWDWTSVTGGDDGLIGIPRAPLEIPGLFSISMRSMSRYYYFVLTVTVLVVYGLHRVVHSPFGLILQGIRENENRVMFAGIPVRRYRLIAFVISGVVAGLAGSMLAPLENTIAPTEAHWSKSAEPVFVTLLGGIHTFEGPIVGAALYLLIKEFIVRYTEFWLMWFGVVLLVLVLGFRGGVVGFFYERALAKLFAERGEGDGK